MQHFAEFDVSWSYARPTFRSAATMPPKKRPAAASASRNVEEPPKKRPAVASQEVEELLRKNAKLEKENAKLRGETPNKKAPVAPDGEA